MNQLVKSIRSFVQEEDGAQVVEYALIIAVVSIALVIALQALTRNGGGFTQFITRVVTCLTTAACV
jgi:pilus assembly protein Flp/PilA